MLEKYLEYLFVTGQLDKKDEEELEEIDETEETKNQEENKGRSR